MQYRQSEDNLAIFGKMFYIDPGKTVTNFGKRFAKKFIERHEKSKASIAS